MKKTLSIGFCLLLFGLSGAAQTNLNRDPKAVKFVTSDIDNFWKAYDLAKNETDRANRVSIFHAEHLDTGGPGLLFSSYSSGLFACHAPRALYSK